MTEHNEEAPEEKPQKKPTRDVPIPQVGEVTIPEEEPPVRGGPPPKIHRRRPLPLVPQKKDDSDPGDAPVSNP